MRLGLRSHYMLQVSQSCQKQLKALLSPCFVKEFPWSLCRVDAGIYTCDHCVACSGFPSAQEKPSSQGSLWGWYTVSGNDSHSCCVAHLPLSRCKIKHMLLVLSWPRLMLLFWDFMSEAQKPWKSLMEKTYEIIPSTHRVVPCKIFSIILSKAVRIHSSKRDPNASTGELLHLPGCQGWCRFIPNLQSKVNFTSFKPPSQVQVPKTGPAPAAVHTQQSTRRWMEAAQPPVMGWVCNQSSNNCPEPLPVTRVL